MKFIKLTGLLFIAAMFLGGVAFAQSYSVGGDEVPELSVRTGNEGGEGANNTHKSVLKPGWGGWGGPFVNYVFLNKDAFAPLTDGLGIDAFPDGMFMYGGMGMGQLGKNFRIGGGGAAGSLYTDGTVLGQDIKALATIGYGGMILYGTYPINDKIDIFARILLGGGGLNITVKGDGLPDDLSESQGFFVYHPAIGIAFHPVKFMSVELEGGYFGTVLQDITIENEKVFDGGSAGGPSVQLNILFGGVKK